MVEYSSLSDYKDNISGTSMVAVLIALKKNLQHLISSVP